MLEDDTGVCLPTDSVGRHYNNGMMPVMLLRLAESADRLCDLVVFVEHASGSVASTDAQLLEIDDALRQWACRCALAEGTVGSVAVVEHLVVP